MDAALLHEDILGVGTGTWGQEIFIAPAHVVQASHAIVVNLTDAVTACLSGVVASARHRWWSFAWHIQRLRNR